MSLKQVSLFLKAWHKWKTLRLPWRRQILVGLDLQGNTYWEFRDDRASEMGRVRRIVRYPSRKTHYGDVAVSPAWHQWLRQTRVDPPSLEEQRSDVVRQQRMKVLAAEADARWAAKPSLVDAPYDQKAQPVPSLKSSRKVVQRGDQGAGRKIPGTLAADVCDKMDTANHTDTAGDRRHGWQKLQKDEKYARKSGPSMDGIDPWKRARGGPSEDWQPKGWDPTTASKS